MFSPDIDYFNYSNSLLDTGKYYNEYLALMSFWRSKYKDSILNVKYESLVKESNLEIKKIISFCGLDWEDGCLEFYKNKKGVSTASSVQVRQPITDKYIGGWRNYEEQLQSLVDYFEPRL